MSAAPDRSALMTDLALLRGMSPQILCALASSSPDPISPTTLTLAEPSAEPALALLDAFPRASGTSTSTVDTNTNINADANAHADAEAHAHDRALALSRAYVRDMSALRAQGAEGALERLGAAVDGLREDAGEVREALGEVRVAV